MGAKKKAPEGGGGVPLIHTSKPGVWGKAYGVRRGVKNEMGVRRGTGGVRADRHILRRFHSF